jgi:hypothetical protein
MQCNFDREPALRPNAKSRPEDLAEAPVLIIGNKQKSFAPRLRSAQARTNFIIQQSQFWCR